MLVKPLLLLPLFALGASAQSSAQSSDEAPVESLLGGLATSASAASPSSTSSPSQFSIPQSCSNECTPVLDIKCHANDTQGCKKNTCDNLVKVIKPCLDCANQTAFYDKMVQDCKNEGFSVSTSGAGALVVSMGAIAAGALLALWA